MKTRAHAVRFLNGPSFYSHALMIPGVIPDFKGGECIRVFGSNTPVSWMFYPGLEIIICVKLILPGVFAYSYLDPGLFSAEYPPLHSILDRGIRAKYANTPPQFLGVGIRFLPRCKIACTQAGFYPGLHTWVHEYFGEKIICTSCMPGVPSCVDKTYQLGDQKQ